MSRRQRLLDARDRALIEAGAFRRLDFVGGIVGVGGVVGIARRLHLRRSPTLRAELQQAASDIGGTVAGAVIA